MLKFIKRHFLKIKIKKLRKHKLNELEYDLLKIQNELDHEGYIRGLCNYDDEDMKNIYNLIRLKDEKYDEIINYKLKYNLK